MKTPFKISIPYYYSYSYIKIENSHGLIQDHYQLFPVQILWFLCITLNMLFFPVGSGIIIKVQVIEQLNNSIL